MQYTNALFENLSTYTGQKLENDVFWPVCLPKLRKIGILAVISSKNSKKHNFGGYVVQKKVPSVSYNNLRFESENSIIIAGNGEKRH